MNASDPRRKTTGIVRLPDTSGQPGHWFSLTMSKQEAGQVRRWCVANLGKPSRMTGSLQTGWVATHPDRFWSVLTHYNRRVALRSIYLVFWRTEAAALFMLFHSP